MGGYSPNATTCGLLATCLRPPDLGHFRRAFQSWNWKIQTSDVDPIYPEVFQPSQLNDKSEGQLYLFLCGLSDPFNLGAVLRSAYFLGVDRVLTSSFITQSAPLTPVVSKARCQFLDTILSKSCTIPVHIFFIVFVFILICFFYSSGVLEIFTPELVRCPETFLKLVRDKGDLLHPLTVSSCFWISC